MALVRLIYLGFWKILAPPSLYIFTHFCIFLIFCSETPCNNQESEIVHAELQQLVYLPLLTINHGTSQIWEPKCLKSERTKSSALQKSQICEICQPKALEIPVCAKEKPLPPGSCLYLYIFIHLFHMFLHMLFVFFV